MGRWRGATFKEYIREELACYARNMSRDMKRKFNLVNITGNAFTDIPDDTLHIIATLLPQCRTAGPNTGLCISTYVLGIGQTNTSGSSRINRYSLWKSPPRASFRVVHSKSHKNPFWLEVLSCFLFTVLLLSQTV